MEHYPKRFLQASLIYLTLGTLLGVMLGVFPKAAAVFRFLHIHMQLFGFLSMMVFGVAYHILPRFNAVAVKKPCLIRLHFYLANAGLLGMGGIHSVKIWHPSAWLTGAFIVAALIAAASMFIFVYNMAPVLKDSGSAGGSACRHAPQGGAATGCPPSPRGSVLADQTVASLVAERPETMAVLVRFGIDMCCEGSHTLAQVCQKKGVDREVLLRALTGRT